MPEMWPLIHARMAGVWGDVAEFAWLSAWRKAEILALEWADLDLGGRRLRIETTKNGDPRILPLDDALWTLIERRHRERVLSPLVFHRAGRPLRDNDLRRAAVTNMINAGVPELVAMAISGHRSLGMLKRYFIQEHRSHAGGARRERAYVAARQAMADKTQNILPRSGLSSS